MSSRPGSECLFYFTMKKQRTEESSLYDARVTDDNRQLGSAQEAVRRLFCVALLRKISHSEGWRLSKEARAFAGLTAIELGCSIPQTPNGRGSCVFCQKNSKSEYKTNGYIILYIQIQPLYQRLST